MHALSGVSKIHPNKIQPELTFPKVLSGANPNTTRPRSPSIPDLISQKLYAELPDLGKI
jgi:hypothetical protein